MARRIVELAEDKQAHEIVLLDIQKLSSLADYFVICSADNERQIKAIVEHIDEIVQHEFDRNPRIEGVSSTGWVVLDYDDVIIHVFSVEQRDYYRLEQLWNKASPVLVIQ